MCGITGIYPFNEIGKFNSINLQRSIESLNHRGPDASGSFLSDKAQFGHTRLAIIDTSELGNQPMKDGSGRYILSFNGEIYNYRELKPELVNSGVKFRSETDTEVLLQLLIKKGEDALNDLNGFFSLAFYDSHEEKLLLARDRFGIKPLVYFQDDDKLVFASELSALRKYGLPEVIDPASLNLFLQLNYIPAPFSILKGFKKLEPGHLLSINGKEVSKKCWYKPLFKKETDEKPLEENSKLIRELVFSSVEKRLVADVPLGGFLSGGIDSSIIAFVANQLAPGFKTFSIAMEGNEYLDESAYAKEVAQHIGTDHSTIGLKPEYLLNSLEKILVTGDEPFADSSLIAVHAVSRETRKHVTVALSGDGADELFGGYLKYQAFLRTQNIGPSERLAIIVAPLLKATPQNRDGKFSNLSRRIRKFSRIARLAPGLKYWELSSPTGIPWPDEILSADYSTDTFRLREELIPFAEPKLLNEVLENDLRLVVEGDMLRKVDLASMSNSLEVRVPFLDHVLVENVQAIGQGQKAIKGKSKILLREAFKNNLPQNVFKRPKKGFEVPLGSWLRNELKSKVEDQWFSAKNNPLEPYVDMDRLEVLKKEILHNKGQNQDERGWALICLYEFLKTLS